MTLDQIAAEAKAEREEFSRVFEAARAKALDRITYPHDGPVTDHVLVYRALQLARAGEFPLLGVHDPVAEALEDALNRDWPHSGA